MAALKLRHPDPAEITQLLDEHHLVVLGEPAVRHRFVRTLAERLASLPESEVVPIRGERATGLASFSRELERALTGAPEPARVSARVSARVPARAPARAPARELSPAQGADGVADIIATLRACPQTAKRQYFLWHDADAMLESDVALFGRIVNALLGVAAEREHISPDRLVIQRSIFLGNDKLGAYAEEEHGQFRTWLLAGDTTPFWEVASCLDRPSVLTFRLEG